MSKMLGELTENITIDLRAALGGVHCQFNFLRGDQRRSQNQTEQNEAKKKTT
jgi:hypothetical protein